MIALYRTDCTAQSGPAGAWNTDRAIAATGGKPQATTLILPQDAPACADDADSVAAYITAETEALAVELFSSTFGMGCRAAWNQAIVELPDLLTYAANWDRDATPAIMLALEVDHGADR